MTNVLENPVEKVGGSKPKYRVLAEELRQQILSRELLPGDSLPTYAEMRTRHNVTISTIDRVYSILEQESLIERQQGRGTFVTEPKRILTGNIGFIGSRLEPSRPAPFYIHLQEGVQQEIEKRQQRLLYLGTNDSWQGQSCEQVDGILICNIENPTRILGLMPPQLPRVSLLTVIPGVTCIAPDDYNGAKAAVNYLINLGHRRIACLMEKMPSQARRRFNGYQDGMLEAGIEVEQPWMRLTSAVGSHDKGHHYLQSGREQMRLWLNDGWAETNCTALLAQNEMSAIGAMQVLQEVGIKVPQEVSVIGFDGTELCDYSTPTLCAMKLPLQEIGAKAVEVLGRQIQGAPEVEQSILFPLQVRAGDSVASRKKIL